jgi:hypothetical protein
MSNPNKRWSWRGAFGRSTGSALAGAANGALGGLLGGPLGAPLGAAVGVAIGFAGGMVGSGLGHLWDDMRRPIEQFGSGTLYTFVVTGFFTLPLIFLAQPYLSRSPDPALTLCALISLVSILGAASKSLLDDLHYTYFVAEARGLSWSSINAD